jgi:hypothetical protein
VFDDIKYEETQIDKIEPFKHSRFKQGLHTLNGNDVVTVVDGKRWRFTLFGMFHQLKDKTERRKEHV